ncbi:MAG: hypothetical protein K2G70_07645 [Turicibacter sp.]|nr:hypothetical protein [Turicibacter sp.]
MENWDNPSFPVNIQELRGELYICKIPDLDLTYQNTYTFADKNAQLNFFKSKAKYSRTNCGVFKYGRNNIIRVNENAENIIDCNYVVFRNNNYTTTGYKYYYAFIVDIIWNAGNQCEIMYEFDVFQTWLFEIQWKRCYVERTHILKALDTPYYTTAPEPFPNFEYAWYSKNAVNTGDLGVILEVLPSNISELNGSSQNAIFTQHEYYYSPMETELDTQNMGFWIDKIVEERGANSLVTAYMVPREALRNVGKSTAFNTVVRLYNDSPNLTPPYENEVNVLNTTTFDGYTVVNNKLLQYPFTTLYTYNQQSFEYYPKEFMLYNGGYKFNIRYSYINPPTITMSPVGYKNGKLNVRDNTSGTQISGFPQCGLYGNNYLNYLNTVGGEDYRRLNYIGGIVKSSYASNILGSSMSTGNVNVGGIAINPASAVLSYANNFINNTKEDYLASYNSGNNSGVINGSVKAAMRDLIGYVGHASYSGEILKRLDRYFTMYGYQINDTMIPNINARDKWVYIKCGSVCNVGGSIPLKHKEKIISCLQNGITFWHGDYVGDYTQVNN